MVLLKDFFEILQAGDPEERQIISGVSWESYEIFVLRKFGFLKIISLMFIAWVIIVTSK